MCQFRWNRLKFFGSDNRVGGVSPDAEPVDLHPIRAER